MDPPPDDAVALPRGFLFGVGTAAPQVEGAAATDGRTPSVWDVFSALPGRVVDGTSGAVAVDHYHRWAEDVALLADLGVDAYRCSMSWSRIVPGPDGTVNGAGIAFYDRLIDGLLGAGIQPWLSLYHWDLPLWSMERGGWLLRETSEAFATYAAVVGDRFGDRVAAWTTLDSPLLHMAYGHAIGIDAPGLTLLGGAFQVTHHLLLAHGLAVAALRNAGAAAVGLANHHTWVEPWSDDDADLRAARCYDLYHNGQFTDPLFAAGYPAALLEMPGVAYDLVHDGDLHAIAAPMDFYGVDYDGPTVVAAAPQNTAIPFSLEERPGVPRTDGGAAIEPAALTRVLIRLSQRYPALPPLYVTENGCAFVDAADGGETPRDDERIAYLASHLGAVAAAVEQGADVRGYFHRSLLDSWALTEGFTRPSGLVRVDPATLARQPRASYGAYRDLIAQHRARSKSA